MPSRSLERDRRQTRNRALQKLRTNGWLPADALTVSYTGGIASVRRPRRAHRLRPKSRTKLRVGGDHSSILRRTWRHGNSSRRERERRRRRRRSIALLGPSGHAKRRVRGWMDAMHAAYVAHTLA
ncbi:hypothetical protein BHM03_00060305 [Ensete ventricosum]|nr:hypothetical protein BHM03_00060305 [Ensete ventricosum]